MPRKLKVAFAGSGENESHATYKDLGFVAREDGAFDVYSAGGLGNNPRFGVLVAEGVAPEKICYYIKAMWLTFRAYGNYENRGKARTRYMQEVCGGPEGYKKAYLEKLQEVLDSGEDLDLKLQPVPLGKKGNGTKASGPRGDQAKAGGALRRGLAPHRGPGGPGDLLPGQRPALRHGGGGDAPFSRRDRLPGEPHRGPGGDPSGGHGRGHCPQPVRDHRQLHWGRHLPGGDAGLPGAAEGVRPGGACRRPAGRGPAPDAHLRLQLLLRHPTRPA